MDQEDLKTFEKILKKNLKNELRTELTPLKNQVNEMQETLDTVKGSVIKIENEIKSHNDAFDIERKRIDKHDTRLTKVEENLNLN